MKTIKSFLGGLVNVSVTLAVYIGIGYLMYLRITNQSTPVLDNIGAVGVGIFSILIVAAMLSIAVPYVKISNFMDDEDKKSQKPSERFASLLTDRLIKGISTDPNRPKRILEVRALAVDESIGSWTRFLRALFAGIITLCVFVLIGAAGYIKTTVFLFVVEFFFTGVYYSMAEEKLRAIKYVKQWDAEEAEAARAKEQADARRTAANNVPAV